MKKLILLFLVFGTFFSCNNEEEVERSEELTFQDWPHAARLKLLGNVSKVRNYTQSSSYGDVRYLASVMTFNESGNLTAYDPTGDDDNITRGWPSIRKDKFTYEYDDQNRLSKIVVASGGRKTNSYTLAYGTHSVYVPLPFDFKPFGEIYLKGLISVKDELDMLNLNFDGTTAGIFISEDGWTCNGTYSFQGNFPVSYHAEYKESDFVVRSVNTTYEFSPSGVMLSRLSKINEDGVLIEDHTKFTLTGLPSENTFGSTTEDYRELQQKNFQYNLQGELTNMDMVVEGETIGSMVNVYSEKDASGNWLRKEQTIDGYLGGDYSSGTEITIREIAYR